MATLPPPNKTLPPREVRFPHWAYRKQVNRGRLVEVLGGDLPEADLRRVLAGLTPRDVARLAELAKDRDSDFGRQQHEAVQAIVLDQVNRRRGRRGKGRTRIETIEIKHRAAIIYNKTMRQPAPLDADALAGALLKLPDLGWKRPATQTSVSRAIDSALEEAPGRSTASKRARVVARVLEMMFFSGATLPADYFRQETMRGLIHTAQSLKMGPRKGHRS